MNTLLTLKFLFIAQPFICCAFLFSIIVLIASLRWLLPIAPTAIAFPIMYVVFTFVGVDYYYSEASGAAQAVQLIKSGTLSEIHTDTYDVSFIAPYGVPEQVLGQPVPQSPPALSIRIPIRAARLVNGYVKTHPDCRISTNVLTQAPFHYDNWGYSNAFYRYGI